MGGEVDVERFPVDTNAVADQAMISPLLGRGIAQSREPIERNRERAPILEVDDERVIGEGDTGSLKIVEVGHLLVALHDRRRFCLDGEGAKKSGL